MGRCRYIALIAVATAALAAGWESAAAGGTLQILHRFKGGDDGAFPEAGLTADHVGNLYGTTKGDSDGAGKLCSKGCGNAYSVVEGGGEQPIFSFNGKDGAQPVAPLLLSNNKFFGTTNVGGTQNSGTVFELTPTGHEKVLHDFCTKPIVNNRSSCADGAYPAGGLVADGVGNVYGTTVEGGANTASGCFSGCGTVFKVGFDGSFAVFYSFCSQVNCLDGDAPFGALIFDSNGDLYGSTQGGGANGRGAVFRLTQDGSTETILYSFCSQAQCADGAEPNGDLIFDANMNIYGTTTVGGRGYHACSYSGGCGVVFELAAPNYNTETILWQFKGGRDGAGPGGGVIRDSAGNLYGTTTAGGGSSFCDFLGTSSGCGTVYEVMTAGAENVLHRFQGIGDGAFPDSSLLLQGNYLFGTALLGGNFHCGGGFGCGTVFKLPIN